MGQNEQGPLTEAVFFILLALYEPRHGYGIMQFASQMSNGRVNIGAGTVYGALNTLLDKKWIRVDSDAGEKGKKVYSLNEEGRTALKLERARLKELIDAADFILKGSL